jgi:hypothetical protein
LIDVLVIIPGLYGEARAICSREPDVGGVHMNGCRLRVRPTWTSLAGLTDAVWLILQAFQSAIMRLVADYREFSITDHAAEMASALAQQALLLSPMKVLPRLLGNQESRHVGNETLQSKNTRRDCGESAVKTPSTT